MNAAFTKEHKLISEVLSILVCRDHRRDADAHRARMLRDVSRRSLALAVSLAPADATGMVSVAQTDSAFAACRSISFATENAVRHGGDYSLNDLLAADRLAREALKPAMTKAFIDRAARGLLKKYRMQHGGKGGAS